MITMMEWWGFIHYSWSSQERIERSKADVARIKGDSYQFNPPSKAISQSVDELPGENMELSLINNLRSEILTKTLERVAVVQAASDDEMHQDHKSKPK